MNLFNDKIEALREFKLAIPKLVRDEVERQESLILSYNVYDQLFELGVTAEGIEIASFAPYAAFTIKRKKDEGAPFDRVTLKDTGAFYKSFFIRTEAEHFIISASDEKTADLTMMYGDSIFGLTPQNLVKFSRLYVLQRLLTELHGKI